LQAALELATSTVVPPTPAPTNAASRAYVAGAYTPSTDNIINAIPSTVSTTSAHTPNLGRPRSASTIKYKRSDSGNYPTRSNTQTFDSLPQKYQRGYATDTAVSPSIPNTSPSMTTDSALKSELEVLDEEIELLQRSLDRATLNLGL
jgi:hypothetical protein